MAGDLRVFLRWQHLHLHMHLHMHLHLAARCTVADGAVRRAVRCASRPTPIHDSPRHTSARTSASFSPMPPVKTSMSSPPSTAAIAATCLRTEEQNISIASRASGFDAAASCRRRMSPLTPEMPSRQEP